MKNITKIGAIMLIIAMSISLYGCQPEEPIATSDNPFALYGLNIRPDGEKIPNKNVDVEGDDAIALAVELYNIANTNDKMTNHRAFYSVCPTSNVAMNMDNKVLLNILEIKNDKEFYRIDYRLKDEIPLFSYFPEKQINNFIKLVTTERRYMHIDMDHTRYQQILNANTDENGIPFAIWTDTSRLEEKTDPESGGSKPKTFSRHQPGDYSKSDHIIEIGTVSTATVTYDAEAGVYKVVMELDVEIDENGNNRATENTRPLILEGANSKDAHYTQILVEFELWDNGYYKEFKSTEFWEGTTVFNLSVDSKFFYHDIYSYDVRDCNISKFYANDEFIDYYHANKAE